MNYESMECYSGQINKTVADLANIGDTIKDGDLAMTILCGLVVSALCNLLDADFTSTNINRRLLAKDARRTEGNDVRQQALVAKSKHSGNKRSHN